MSQSNGFCNKTLLANLFEVATKSMEIEKKTSKHKKTDKIHEDFLAFTNVPIQRFFNQILFSCRQIDRQCLTNFEKKT